MRNRILIAIAAVATLSLLGATVATGSDSFIDVGEDNIFHDDITWMSDNGITFGYGDGTYGPDDNMTRGQMAAFMHRLYNRVQQDIPNPDDLIVEIVNEVEGGEITVTAKDGKDGRDGVDGVDGQDGVSGYSVHGGEIPVQPGDFTVTKACKDGKVAIGGGFRIFAHGNDVREDVSVTVSSPGSLVDTGNGWVATAWEVQGHHAGGQAATLDVQVICANLAD